MPNGMAIRRNSNAGLIAGLFGCLFGLLGIFTLGLIFVPLAALCGLIGLLRGVLGGSVSGTGTSLLAGVLTAIGVVSSPSIWMLLAGGVIASTPKPSNPSPPTYRSNLHFSPTQETNLKLALQKRAATEANQQQASKQFAGTTCYMDECFDQYIEETSKETNDVIRVRVRTRNYSSFQPKITLGLPTYDTHWVSCRSSGGYIENEQHVRLAQPNSQPSHATEPGDNLWKAVCGIR